MTRKTRSNSVYFEIDRGLVVPLRVFWRINPQTFRWQQGNKGSVRDTLDGFHLERIQASNPEYSAKTLPTLIVAGTTGVAFRREVETMQFVFDHREERKPDGSPVDINFFDFGGTDDENFLNVPVVSSLGFVNFDFGNPAALFRLPSLSEIQDAAVARFGADLTAAAREISPDLVPIIQRLGIGRTPLGTHRNTQQVYNGVERYADRGYQVEIENFSYDESVNAQNEIKFQFQLRVLRNIYYRARDAAINNSFGGLDPEGTLLDVPIDAIPDTIDPSILIA